MADPGRWQTRSEGKNSNDPFGQGSLKNVLFWNNLCENGKGAQKCTTQEQWISKFTAIFSVTRYKILYFPNQGPWRVWYNIYN
jgi:hypothetical protein